MWRDQRSCTYDVPYQFGATGKLGAIDTLQTDQAGFVVSVCMASPNFKDTLLMPLTIRSYWEARYLNTLQIDRSSSVVSVCMASLNWFAGFYTS
jgi:hypothetical protein